ncbi:MAG: hypothetical protein CVU52_01435 [Deltaproteobacteria bacterium HGW-Deltaproteobacteria-10]|nr:MAG: hypothetical protein CVU52_01435 [Deltaproteobacteria bacterium HGW-Deltaproteobacteria-10]
MANIKKSVKNSSVKRLLDAIEMESAATARIKAMTEIMDMLAKEIKYGTFDTACFQHDLKTIIDQENKNLKANADGPLKAFAAMEIEATLEAMNIRTPSLIAQLIEKDNNIKAAIEEDGHLTIIIEGKNGITGDTLENHIAKMKKDPATSFLFVEDQPRKDSQQKQVVKNPWSKEYLNLTEQGKIFSQSPAIAERMKAEAGVM